jgi:hypothetical protein
MSLINDALKRASVSDRSRSSPAALPRLRKAAEAARGPELSWVMAVFVAVALLLAGLFFWKWWEASHAKLAATPARAPAAAAKAAMTPAPPASPAPPATPVAVAIETPPPPATPSAAPAAKAPEPMRAGPMVEAGWPMELTLKGILYSRTSPRALINGKAVGPGESVGGALIARIETDRVVVEWNGQRKELILKGN